MNKNDKKSLKAVCVIIAFIVAWLPSEDWIFQHFFSTKLNATFSSIQVILNNEKLNRGDAGFDQVLALLNVKTETGQVMTIQEGGSTFIEGRENQLIHTYWLIPVRV